MADRHTYYVTVAIDYSNGEPHIGHAYEKVAADAIARYHRLRGVDTYYVMGTDEHSVNVARRAREHGLTPKAYSDQMAAVFRNTWDQLGIDYSCFMQTSDERHIRAVQTLVQRIHDRGFVFQGSYKGWYCVSCEAFYTEKDLEGGQCPVHKRPVEFIEEQNYFFRLSAFQEPLLKHIESHPEFIQPESRRNEILNVIRQGLEDISISRSQVDWGVPVPWDPRQVVYVWFDALITYLSGAGFGWDDERFERYWPADLHLIGKDITRFHCIIWPAMLMAAGLPLPKTVFGHGWLLFRGERLSKSTGNMISTAELLGPYGLDPTRYCLLTEAVFGQDGNVSHESFIKRINSDLANDLGNLLSRTTAMVDKYCAGRVPRPSDEADDGELAARAEESVRDYAQAMEELRINDAIDAVFGLVRRANKYIDEVAPWDLAKDLSRSTRLATVLYNLCETLRITGILLTPFLVRAPEQLFEQLGLPPQSVRTAAWNDLAWGGLPEGTVIRRGQPLFPRLDAEAVHSPVASPTSVQEGATDPDWIGIEEFQRLDLRVATITEAEPVSGADRLLRITVTLGNEERQIVSGLAQHYRPEQLIGKQVVLVANLKPAKIRGVESRGMLLAASNGTSLALIGPEAEIQPGSRVK